jgi:hypothetical protein
VILHHIESQNDVLATMLETQGIKIEDVLRRDSTTVARSL